MTTSAPATASAPESKTLTPLASAASFKAGTGSKPRTVWPAVTRLAAIRPPLLPSPRNAMVVIDLEPFCLRGSPRPSGFSPADDHPHDFVGSLEDSMHPQIADDLLQPVLAQVPVAAVELQRLIGDRVAVVRDVPLGHRAEFALVRVVLVERSGRTPQQVSGRLERGGHVGEGEPDGRLVEELDAERLAVGEVGD